MKRKVIQISENTLVITLPSTWVKRNNVKKGAEVDVVPRNAHLSVSIGEPRVEEHIDLKGMSPKFITYVLASFYKSGTDKLRIDVDPEHMEDIRQYTSTSLTGFTVTRRARHTCTLESMTTEREDQLDMAFRRAFLVTLELAEQSLEYIKKNELKKLKELLHLEVENNQWTNLGERILVKQGDPKAGSAFFCYVLLSKLEKIADSYKDICNYLSEQQTDLSQKVLTFYQDVNMMLRSYYDLYYQFSPESLQKINRQAKEVLEEGKDLFSEIESHETYVLHELVKLSGAIQELTSTIVAVRWPQG